MGREHLYSFAPNSQMWVDVFGLSKKQIQLNRETGKTRENIFHQILKDKYPNARIERERYLRDCKTGKSVRDSNNSRRRLDFIVIENLNDLKKRKSKCFEVTSLSATKDAQRAKEKAIRKKGGLCIRLKGYKGTDGLIKVPLSIIKRLD